MVKKKADKLFNILINFKFRNKNFEYQSFHMHSEKATKKLKRIFTLLIERNVFKFCGLLTIYELYYSIVLLHGGDVLVPNNMI